MVKIAHDYLDKDFGIESRHSQQSRGCRLGHLNRFPITQCNPGQAEIESTLANGQDRFVWRPVFACKLPSQYDGQDY